MADKQRSYSFFIIPFRISEILIMIKIVTLGTVKNTWRDMEDIHRVQPNEFYYMDKLGITA